jgi:OmpA-OmpF porin, OOP family
MKYSVLGMLLLISCLSVRSQNSKPDVPTATVNVVVTNFKLVPLKSAEVLFINPASRKSISGRTDAGGKFSMTLPAGNKYIIKLKTLNDTIDYSNMEIPALGPGEFFDEAITVNIKYDPPRTFTLDNVHFDTGKPILRAASFKELDEIAEYMKMKEEEQYEIAGHTDNVGKEEDNLKLSQQRAESVKNYLIKKGIPANRLSAKGYGASQPVADNSTESGRQKNRRTEVKIL